MIDLRNEKTFHQVALLRDPKLCAVIARTSRNPWVRCAAVGNVVRRSTLENIKDNDAEWRVRHAAAMRLEQLAEI
jgi:hypothetical protein